MSDDIKDSNDHAGNFEFEDNEEQFFITYNLRLLFNKCDSNYPDRKGIYYIILAGLIFAIIMQIYN